MIGATGAIGRAVTERATIRDWTVVGATRGEAPQRRDGVEFVSYDSLRDDAAGAFDGSPPFDAVCWAGGANFSDSLQSFDAQRNVDLYRDNCLSIIVGAAALLETGLLSKSGARLVVVSSIWQERARPNKLSYCMTKAALGGFVRSASVDLGADGHLINAVLPGVLDTPMTAANLSPDQIATVAGKTSAGRLPDLTTVAETILFLCSTGNTSISGQSITIDLGMNNASIL